MPPVAVAIGAVVTAAAAAATAAVVAASTLIASFGALAAFLATPFGALIVGIGLSLISTMFIKKPNGGQAPSIEAAKVNVRIAEPERWLSFGRNRLGGGVVFAEFDEDGNFWYLIIHSDTNYSTIEKRYFDDVEITLDENNYVNEDDFCLTTSGEALFGLSGSSTRVKYFQVFSTTYSQNDPTPPPIQEFKDAFPNNWSDDHKLVGTSYSIVKIKPVSPENRYKIFRWRGPIGLAEPSFSIVANCGYAYDPRDNSQTVIDKTTHTPTRNPALAWAWYRMERYGRNKKSNSINWGKVAEMADICDNGISDINGDINPLYRCDISIPESTERSTGEQQILMSCDAQLVFDDDGKCWPRVGYYYDTPVKLTRNRDIIAMESVEANNGESITQGVIVRYIDPDSNYTTQPSRPYINPFYYIEGETPKYITIDILTIQDHRQAMTLAKSISMRSQSQYKLMPVVGLRGLPARQHRIVNLQYDNNFAGDHEINTNVEVEKTGAFCSFGCVPIDEYRWTLLPGEEKAKPVISDITLDYTPLLPSNVIIEFTNDQIEARFDPSERDDWFYIFEFQKKIFNDPDENEWRKMISSDNHDYAYSGIVQPNADYFVRWHTSSSGGKVSDFIDPVVVINTVSLNLSGTPVTTGQVGVTYSSFTVAVTGGQSPYIFSDIYNRLPPGLNINIETGVISGTPVSTGTYSNIIILVQDSDNKSNRFDEFEIVIT